MNKLKNIFRVWLPIAIVVAAFCSLSYITVQQSQRQDANDPQIQMAEDAAAALNKGAASSSLLPRQTVDIATSLAPFIIVFDTNGNAVAASGLLDGQMPDYPIEVVVSTKGSGENRVTWQPKANVRIASVAIPFNNGYVVAGRNLREIEKRESQTEIFAGLTGLLALIATFLAVAFGEFLLAEKK